MLLGPVQRILDERIVKRPKDERPAHQCRTGRLHLQNVAEHCPLFVKGLNVIAMRAVEAPRGCKAEPNALAWIVCLDAVADGAVSANGSYL